MKLAHAVIAVGATALVGIGGGVAAAQIGDDDPAKPPAASPKPSSSGKPTPSATPTPTPTPTAPVTSTTTKPTPAPKPVDRLSDENVITPELYRQVTGNRIIHADAGMFRLSACTGSRTFESLTASATDRIAQSFSNEADGFIVEQIAQSASSAKAQESAGLIIGLVDACESTQGGDFGYGDPVTLGSGDPDSRIVYFPAYDSDRADMGGYVVFQVGKRVGYLDINAPITADELSQLAVDARDLAAK